MDIETTDFGLLTVLVDDPDLFQNFVELFVVVEAENLLRSDASVMKLDAAIGKTRDGWIVGDHDNGATLLMKFAEKAKDDLFVVLVEIASGFVGEDDLGIINEGASDAYALLFTTRHVCGEMMGTVAESDAFKSFESLILISHAVEVLG